MWQSKKILPRGTALRRDVTTGGPIVMLGTGYKLNWLQGVTKMTVHNVDMEPICSKVNYL
jgi:hypothetical protein